MVVATTDIFVHVLSKLKLINMDTFLSFYNKDFARHVAKRHKPKKEVPDVSSM